MANIQVATFEQLTTILTKLATNYSNIFIDYFNLFYNPNPMDVVVQIYDEAGALQTYTIPNRAKDRNFILNGNGSPEGVVSASKGTTYQDLENGSLYIKIAGNDASNWSKLLSSEEFDTAVTRGSGSPEGELVRPKGAIYIDEEGAAIYIKTGASGSVGWTLATANTNILASTNLDNLTADGENHFANPSLSNLNSTGAGIINSKEDVDNKVISLDSSSTDTQYPSAKATYDLVSETTAPLANRNLDNLTTDGEEHFLGKPQIGDCVLYAPNGVASVSGDVVNIPSGMVLLAPNGRDSNKSLINERIITLNRTASVSGTGYNGFAFYNATSSNVLVAKEDNIFRQIAEPTESEYPSVWYSKDQNVYKIKSSSDSSWETAMLIEVASFTINLEGAITKFDGYYPIKLASEYTVDNAQKELRDNINKLEEDLESQIVTIEGQISTVSAAKKYTVPTYSSSSVSVTFPKSSAKYTAPKSGIYCCSFGLNEVFNLDLYINSATSGIRYSDMKDSGGLQRQSFCVPLKKGDVIYWNTTTTPTDYLGKFHPYKSVEA